MQLRRSAPSGRTTVRLVLLAALLAPALAPLSSQADSDHLHDRKHHLQNQIDAKKVDLDDISQQLVSAQGRLDAAVDDLGVARARLATAKDQLQAAALADQQMQERLDQAIVRLRNARDDLAKGSEQLGTKTDELKAYALAAYQNGGLDTLSLSVAFQADGPQAAVDSMQDVRTALDKQAVDVQEVKAMQVLLTLTEQRVEDTKNDVAVKRQEAAAQLKVRQAAEAEAESAQADVASRVTTLRVERGKLAAAKHAERVRLDKMRNEREKIAKKLRELARQRAKQHHSSINHASAHHSGFLSYPVNNTYITSPYGMRLHPILHIWELHDGTDLHAPCGTPVYAAAPGRIYSEYYSSAYGNRLFIDHGYVKGVSLNTSYNHLTSFVAGVGQHVERGQLIAYSGTTGWSTACHLHFMVYVNGATTDPMNWL